MSDEVTYSPIDWVKEHTKRYVDSGGTDGHEWRPGVPTLVLTTTGRKTGLGRRTALIYGRDHEDYIVVASKGGAPEHPSWYLNLTAEPEVEVQVGPQTFTATARTATADERTRLWPLMTAIWPDYDNYARRTQREIPVVLITPHP